jgi:hypothetical protein
MTKNISRVNYVYPESSVSNIDCKTTTRRYAHTPVHMSFWLNGTLVSGEATSGRMGVKGLIKSRNRTIFRQHQPCLPERKQIADGLTFAIGAQGELTSAHCAGCFPQIKKQEKKEKESWLKRPAKGTRRDKMGEGE